MRFLILFYGNYFKMRARGARNFVGHYHYHMRSIGNVCGAGFKARARKYSRICSPHPGSRWTLCVNGVKRWLPRWYAAGECIIEHFDMRGRPGTTRWYYRRFVTEWARSSDSVTRYPLLRASFCDCGPHVQRQSMEVKPGLTGNCWFSQNPTAFVMFGKEYYKSYTNR